MIISASSATKKLLLLFLIIGGLHYAKSFLIPLSVGGVLATLFLPLCKWMERKQIPRALSAFSCLLIILITIGCVSVLLGWQIYELTNNMVLLKQKVVETINCVQEYIFNFLGVPIAKQLQILKNEQPSITRMIELLANSFTSISINFILTLAYVFLLLYYRSHIRNFILKLSSPSQQNETREIIDNAAQVSQHYLTGLAKMIVCLWIMYSMGFSIMGVKNALFFAILCGLLEIVPFIGNITGTTVTVLIAAVQGASPVMLAGIVGTYGLVQFIQGWVLEPIIVGPQVKINPFTTIMALVIGELVWGIPGIFLAIPLIAMFKIVCDHIEPLKPLGFLIGQIETPKGESGFIKKIKKWF